LKRGLTTTRFRQLKIKHAHVLRSGTDECGAGSNTNCTIQREISLIDQEQAANHCAYDPNQTVPDQRTPCANPHARITTRQPIHYPARPATEPDNASKEINILCLAIAPSA
jgi:hypothetical protein